MLTYFRCTCARKPYGLNLFFSLNYLLCGFQKTVVQLIPYEYTNMQVYRFVW